MESLLNILGVVVWCFIGVSFIGIGWYMYRYQLLVVLINAWRGGELTLMEYLRARKEALRVAKSSTDYVKKIVRTAKHVRIYTHCGGYGEIDLD